MKILSLSSSVAHGHVGNSALTLPLQRLGFAVSAINTVQFSNHPGHGTFGGDVFAAGHVSRVVDGLEAAGFLGGHDGVLSGYLGDAANGASLMRMLAANPRAPYLCDPVMGDDGRSYVRPGIAEFLCGPALAAATIVTPNPFELGVLAGAPVSGLEQSLAAARTLLRKGPRLVVVTSLEVDGDMACAAVTDQGRWLVRTPRLPFPQPVNGAGDLLAGLLLAQHLSGTDAPRTLSLAVSRLFAVLQATWESGERELALVAAQDRLANPARLFAVQQS
ncbi:MAG: pyridoxal kinase [Magnetospirillum sp.]|nr:pyridoxal kinase [Magnetospirillum sp.]